MQKKIYKKPLTEVEMKIELQGLLAISKVSGGGTEYGGGGDSGTGRTRKKGPWSETNAAANGPWK